MENGTVVAKIKGSDVVDAIERSTKRDRRTQEEVKHDHYQEVLTSLTLEQKVNLVKYLQVEIQAEITNKKEALESALSITNSLNNG